MAAAERPRWSLWLPVFLGAGAALYFALPAEPPGWSGPALLAAAIVLGWAGRRYFLFALAAAVILGLGAAKMRESLLAAPVLEKSMVAHLSGRLEAIDWRDRGARLVLGDVASGAMANPPARVRIAVPRADGLVIGQGLSLTADLLPPPGPTMPGDRDFARAAFFDRIGAVGFAYGKPLAVPAPPAAWPERLREAVEGLRQTMTARIRAAIPGSDGAIASALITGMRGGIAPEDESALRDAGLAHVLAIAGLHMALVGMGLFWLARAILAAIPALALGHPIKKWAAGAALVGAMFYLVISGATASSVRAFVMLAMMLLAVLLDRPALSMRNLAFAAAILILVRPESIVEPGFQMSFAAVAALVALAEWERTHPRGALWRYLRGIAVTSLVGSLATMPFAAFHFGRVTHYAVLGNLLAMPLMGFWVMPAAALSVLGMPFGLEAGPLHLLAWGVDLMLAAGRFVSGLPGAVTVLPSFPGWALALMSLGGLWLLLWRRRWRWLGLLPLFAGLVLAVLAPRPDILVAADGRTAALRGGDGRLAFILPPRDLYAAENWLKRDGDLRPPDQVPSIGRCDGQGCVAVVRGVRLALSLRPEALDEDCRRAALLLARPAVVDCGGPKLVLDGPAIAGEGGYAITVGSTLQALGVNSSRGRRPWVIGPRVQ
jgi:competence protein ComEC